MADLIARLAARSRDSAPALRRRPDAAFRTPATSGESPLNGVAVDTESISTPDPAVATPNKRPGVTSPASFASAGSTPPSTPSQASAQQRTVVEAQPRVATLSDVIAALDAGSPAATEPERLTVQRLPAGLGRESLSAEVSRNHPTSPTHEQHNDQPSITLSIGQLIVRAGPPAPSPSTSAPESPTATPAANPALRQLSLQNYLRGRRETG